ncbi:MAG: SDR family NAD(P)-dependent oxidoreductase, partial [Armatimonadetes bacterium]|nr:SDR family NAD(P)-dependent oxidoreductase [Armatimonadota bacterium]
MDRENHTALITGASRGIGAAIALRLAADGADIAINYVEVDDRDNAAEADAVAEQVRDLGCEAICVEADVTDREAVADMVEYVKERLGPVDILVNNAGITLDRTMRKLPPEDWDRVLAVNLTGAFNCARAVVEG